MKPAVAQTIIIFMGFILKNCVPTNAATNKNMLMQIRDEILGLDINNLTPMEALNKLNSIKHILTGK